MKKSLFSIALILLALSCSKEAIQFESDNGMEYAYQRSFSDVKEIVNTFLDGPDTKESGMKPQIKEIKPLRNSSTKSSVNSVLYVVNLADDQGFMFIPTNKDAEPVSAYFFKGQYGEHNPDLVENLVQSITDRLSSMSSGPGDMGIGDMIWNITDTTTTVQYDKKHHLFDHFSIEGPASYYLDYAVDNIDQAVMAMKTMAHFRPISSLQMTHQSFANQTLFLDWDALSNHNHDNESCPTCQTIAKLALEISYRLTNNPTSGLQSLGLDNEDKLDDYMDMNILCEQNEHIGNYRRNPLYITDTQLIVGFKHIRTIINLTQVNMTTGSSHLAETDDRHYVYSYVHSSDDVVGDYIDLFERERTVTGYRIADGGTSYSNYIVDKYKDCRELIKILNTSCNTHGCND